MKKQVTHPIHIRIFLSKLQEEIKRQSIALEKKGNTKIIISCTLNNFGTPVGIANIGFIFEKNDKFETFEIIIVDEIPFKILLPQTIGIDYEK